MMIPWDEEAYVIRDASGPRKLDCLSCSEFETAFRERTRVRGDPEALQRFAQAWASTVGENPESRAQRAKRPTVKEAKLRD